MGQKKIYQSESSFFIGIINSSYINQLSKLKFLNTYELSFSPNDNFDVFVGVFYDFAKNEMAYEPILEFGLNTISIKYLEDIYSYFYIFSFIEACGRQEKWVTILLNSGQMYIDGRSLRL